MKFRVAILLATFNGSAWIKEQIDSILAQVDVEIALFIGDDCSSDGTVAMIGREYGRDARVSVLEGVHGKYGSPAANFFRLLLDVSFEKFDYVFLSDQDDYWYSNKIYSAIQKMRLLGADCYAADLVCLYPDGRRKLLRKSYMQTENDFLFQGASAGCTYGLSVAAANLCKTAVAEMSQDFRKLISHDWAIYALTRSNMYKWVLDSGIYIDYRQHGKNAYGALGVKSYAKRFNLLRNGWYRQSIIALGGVCVLNEDQAKIILAVERFNFRDRVFLLSRSWSFRRRPIEKIYLMGLLLFNLI